MYEKLRIGPVAGVGAAALRERENVTPGNKLQDVNPRHTRQPIPTGR
jgi:hypothetical protein